MAIDLIQKQLWGDKDRGYLFGTIDFWLRERFFCSASYETHGTNFWTEVTCRVTVNGQQLLYKSGFDIVVSDAISKTMSDRVIEFIEQKVVPILVMMIDGR